MNKSIFIILLIALMNILFAEDQILWDLGIVIKKDHTSTSDVIKPLISNTQIKPSYVESMKQLNLFDISSLAIPSNHIINLLYWNKQYLKLTEYVNDNWDIESISDVDRIIYSDALYQLGQYNQAIDNLNLLSESYPKDEKYFMLALYNKKVGNKKDMVALLKNIIEEHPDSDYINLAKLQIQGLK